MNGYERVGRLESAREILDRLANETLGNNGDADDAAIRRTLGIVHELHQTLWPIVGHDDETPLPAVEKTPGEKALDDIAELCGCPQWEYPAQVVRDVADVIDHASTLARNVASTRDLANRPDLRQQAEEVLTFLTTDRVRPRESGSEGEP